MAIQKHVVPGYTAPVLAIWAETANINYFLKTPLVPAGQGTVTNKQAAVPSHTRRQYPGDPTPINVGGTVREFIHDPGRRSGNATPGKDFWLYSDVGLPGDEKRKFTYQGRITDLHAFLVGEVAMQVHLVGPSGARYVIDAPAP
jgi:hypothetical protein